MNITISDDDIKDVFKEQTGKALSTNKLRKFKEYLADDIYEWLKDNVKSFTE